MTKFIRCDEDLDRHIARLAKAHPVFAPLYAETGAVPIRWLDSGFKGLVFVVTGQQISIAAGRAIYNRLEAALEGITPETLAAAGDDVLRAAGFSAPKMRTLRALQEAALSGVLDMEALERQSAEDAIAALCTIRGSARGRRRSTFCSAWAIPTSSPPPTSPCKKRRALPSRSTDGRCRAICALCRTPGRPGAAPPRACFGPITR